MSFVPAVCVCVVILHCSLFEAHLPSISLFVFSVHLLRRCVLLLDFISVYEALMQTIKCLNVECTECLLLV